MKTKKLTLKDLKVESFITSLENQKVNTVKGGSTPLCVEIAVSAMTVGAVAGGAVVGANLGLIASAIATIFKKDNGFVSGDPQYCEGSLGNQLC